MLANIPCKNFPKIYGIIEISVSAIIAYICNTTEIPPNPNKNAEIIILVDNNLLGNPATKEMPFVNSKIPDIIGTQNLVSILKKFIIGINILDNISNTLLVLSIEIIILNKTIKPPIIKIVFIEFEILEPSIFDELALKFLFRLLEFIFSVSFNFQNLKIMPTLIQASI